MNTRKFYFITCAAIFLILFLLCEYLLESNAQITRSGNALNIGWIFSLPYDISNTLRSPLAGPLSIILAGGLAMIMMFGLLVAPVYYLFGSPTRPYHFNDASKEPIEPVISRSFKDNGFISHLIDSASYYNSSKDAENIGQSEIITDTNVTFSDDYIATFLEGAFFFLPEKDENCKKLMVCHAHGFLGFMPEQVLRFYRFFSKKIPSLPKSYQEAIIMGLDDQSSCQYNYDCSKDISAIAKSTLFHIIPRKEDDFTTNENKKDSANLI